MMDIFFNDTATTEIYTLSLHDALPISELGNPRRGATGGFRVRSCRAPRNDGSLRRHRHRGAGLRSEEHTSELQSRQYLVCRLLLEKIKSSRAIPFCTSPIIVKRSPLFS